MKLKLSENAAHAIEHAGIVCILRMDDAQAVLKLVGALFAGGIRCFEIPLTASNAGEIIGLLKSSLPDDVIVGAGTVLSAETAEEIIAAGATFIVSPHFVPEVAEVCKARGVVLIPGAFSPQEIFHAWKAGADIVKVFSIRPLGPEYLRDLAGPYPGIKLMPTGGIDSGNAADFIRAGACAVTIGRDIIGKGPWDEAALAEITRRAQNLVTSIQEAKGLA